jgi:hypothetical protein
MVKGTCRLASGACASDRLALRYSQRRVGAPGTDLLSRYYGAPSVRFRDGTRMEIDVSHPVRGSSLKIAKALELKPRRLIRDKREPPQPRHLQGGRPRGAPSRQPGPRWIVRPARRITRTATAESGGTSKLRDCNGLEAQKNRPCLLKRGRDRKFSTLDVCVADRDKRAQVPGLGNHPDG